MDESDRSEIAALVVGFLQQSLKDNPQGFTVQEFERLFPERCDEPRDWYKRYNKKTTLEALECIKDSVQVSYNSRYNATTISLNLRSEKVDRHLVDLITNQKASSKGKKGRGRPSSRALASFSLNRQYSSSHYGRSSGYRSTRLNYEQPYRSESLYSKKTSSAPIFKPPSIYTKQVTSSRTAANDPRLRNSTITSSNTSTQSTTVPPQVRQSSLTSNFTGKQSTRVQPQVTPLSNNLGAHRASLSKSTEDSSQKSRDSKKEDKEADPEIVQKRIYFRQRLLSLLTRKFSEIKVLFLTALYEEEFEETLDPTALGYPNLTSLFKDSNISPYIQVNCKGSFLTVSAKSRATASSKENIGDLKLANAIAANPVPPVEPTPPVSSLKAKLDANDTFNLRTMINDLEPLGEIVPLPLKSEPIDEAVKMKTLRIIFLSPGQTLKLEDWPCKYEQLTRLKIRIEDYGFRTHLEFFKELSRDLPISIRLSKKDDWIAVVDVKTLSLWVQKRLSEGHYRALTAIESRWEHVAYPDDIYKFATPSDMPRAENFYHPVHILSTKRPSFMWLQLRTPEKIEAFLNMESSMTSYEDYKKKGLFTVPLQFVKPGFPCAVYDATLLMWCRALVLKAPEVVDRNYEITAFLVDYAMTKNYKISNLLCLMKNHLNVPVGPIYSRLAGINDDKAAVQKNAKLILQEYTSPPVTLACNFAKAIESKEPKYLPQYYFEVSLVDTRHGKDCNLADDINAYEEEKDTSQIDT